MSLLRENNRLRTNGDILVQKKAALKKAAFLFVIIYK
jgi:hypothetical protein